MSEDCQTKPSKGPNFDTTLANIRRALSKAKFLKNEIDYLRNGALPKDAGTPEMPNEDITPSIGTLDTYANDCANVLSECMQLMSELRGK